MISSFYVLAFANKIQYWIDILQLRGKPVQSQWDAPIDEFTKDINLSPSNNDEIQSPEPYEKGESNERDGVPNKSKDDIIAPSAED